MEILNDIPTKKAKRLTSVVWNHFERVRKADAQYAVCLHCKKKLSGSSNSGTTHLRNHLLRCLKRSNYDVSQILAAKRKRKESSQSPLHQTNVGLTSIVYEEAKMKDEILSPIPIKYYSEQKSDEFYHSINLGSIKFDQDRSRLDLARMIMLHGYPLDMVDHYGFKIFVNNLQPLFELNSSGVIELDCMAIYGKEKQKVYESLYHFHGRISLAVDMWGSPEGYDYEYIGLTANYIDDAWKLQKKMLNFISLDPSSTDDMISEAIIKSSIDWAIDGKLCSMTFDDCSSHEVMVFKVKDWLSQNRPLLKSGELFDVRCVMHLLKSIAQEVIESFRDVTHKIRESVRHVKSTQQLVMKFNELADQVGIDSRHLVLDHPMHWNSTYSMLESAVQNKAAFHLLRQHDPSYSKALSETEWEQASAIAGYMRFLLEFTNIVIQNKNPTANIFFQEICDMHIKLNEWCKSHDDFLSSVALRMKIKFDVYWSKCSLVLAITAILDPRFKMKLVEYYFRQIYGAAAAHNRIKEVSNGLRELFNEYFVGSSSLNQDHGSSLSSNVSKDKLKGFDKFLHETCENQSMTSDLEKYLEEPVFPRNYDFNILNWWKVHMPRYPILSMMARDFLSIPVSTIGPDLAFSNCGRVVDKYHMSLSPESREAFICGQDWLKIEPKGL